MGRGFAVGLAFVLAIGCGGDETASDDPAAAADDTMADAARETVEAAEQALRDSAPASMADLLATLVAAGQEAAGRAATGGAVGAVAGSTGVVAPDGTSIDSLLAALAAQQMRATQGPVPGISDSSWLEPQREVRGGDEADLVVRVGDIDNFGFGWPSGFDPFSGRSTPRHRFPFDPGENDPPGTDRIMVVSGHRSARGDGYTATTRRPANAPQPLQLVFDPAGLTIRAAALQLFLDDFQAPSFGTRFQVTLDGRPAPDIAAVVNELRQTGPIGKLVTVQLLA